MPVLRILRSFNLPEGWSLSKKSVGLNAISQFLISTRKGSLARQIRFDNFFASAFGLELEMLGEQKGLMELWAQPDEGVNLDQLSKEILAYFSTISAGKIPQNSWTKVQAKLVKIEENRKADRQHVFNRLINDMALEMEPLTGEDYIKNIKSLTLKDIQGVFELLAQGGRTVIVPMAAHISKN